MTRRIMLVFAALALIAVALGFYALHLKRKSRATLKLPPSNSWP